MREKITREEAKELIAETILTNSNCNLPRLKKDFPYYDYAEEINKYISEGVLKLSKENLDFIAKEEFFEVQFEKAFKPIYKLYFIDCFCKVINEYLEKKSHDLGIDVEVYGEVESTGECPCCHYYSIDYGEDGLWDICPVCFWENGGDSPNGMPLKEAQGNFKKYGAMDKGSLKFVNADAKMKYKKAD